MAVLSKSGIDALLASLFVVNTNGDIEADEVLARLRDFLDSYPNSSTLDTGDVPMLTSTSGVSMPSGINVPNDLQVDIEKMIACTGGDGIAFGPTRIMNAGFSAGLKLADGTITFPAAYNLTATGSTQARQFAFSALADTAAAADTSETFTGATHTFRFINANTGIANRYTFSSAAMADVTDCNIQIYRGATATGTPIFDYKQSASGAGFTIRPGLNAIRREGTNIPVGEDRDDLPGIGLFFEQGQELTGVISAGTGQTLSLRGQTLAIPTADGMSTTMEEFPHIVVRGRTATSQDLAIDANVLHDNVAGEVAALPQKLTPTGADLIPINDSADGNAIKHIQISSLGISELNAFAYKTPVKAASTENVSLTATTLTLDGITLIAGDRVLLKDQTTGTQNGIYNFFPGALVRAADADSSGDLEAGTAVIVEDGATNRDMLFVLTTNNPIVLGTTNLDFAALRTAPTAETNFLGPLDAAPSTTGFRIGDLLNVNGDLLELVSSTDDSNIIRGIGAAAGTNYIGVRDNVTSLTDVGQFTDSTYRGEFLWRVVESTSLALQRGRFDRRIWSGAPPANLYFRFVDATGFVSDLIMARNTSFDTGSGTGPSAVGTYGYSNAPTGVGIETPAGTAFSLLVFTDPGFSVPLAVHRINRWEDYYQRQLELTRVSDTERIQDTVGAMFSGNVEDGVSAVYQDDDGTIDLAFDGLTIQDEGNTLNVGARTLNFTGAGVSATGTGGTKVINITGMVMATRTIVDFTSNVNINSQSQRDIYVRAIARMNVQGTTGSNIQFQLPSLQPGQRPSWLQPGDTFVVRDNNASTSTNRVRANIRTASTGDTFSINNSSQLNTIRPGQTYQIVTPGTASRVYQVLELASNAPADALGDQTYQLWFQGENGAAYRSGDVVIDHGEILDTDRVLDHVTASTFTAPDQQQLVFDDELALFQFWTTYDDAMPAITATLEGGVDDTAARTYFDANVRNATQVAVPKLPIPNPDPDAQATVNSVAFHSAGQVQVGYTDNTKLEAGTVVGGYVRLSGVSSFHDGIWEIAPGGIDEGVNTLILLNPAATDNSEDVSSPTGATATNVIYGWKTDTAIEATGSATYTLTMNLYAANDVNTAYPALQSYWFDPSTPIDSLTQGNALNIGYQNLVEHDAIISLNSRDISVGDGSINVLRVDDTTMDNYYANGRRDIRYIDNTAAGGDYQLHRNISSNAPIISVRTDAESINYVPNPTTFTEDQIQRYIVISHTDNDAGDVQVGVGQQGNVRRFDNGFFSFAMAAGEVVVVEAFRANGGAQTGVRVISSIIRSKSSIPTATIDSSATAFTSATLSTVPVITSEFDQTQDQDPGNTVFAIGGVPGSATENGFQMTALGKYRLTYYMTFSFTGSDPTGPESATIYMVPRVDTTELSAFRFTEDFDLSANTKTIRMEAEYINNTVDQVFRIEAGVEDIPAGYTFADFSYRRDEWFIEYIG